MELRLRMNRLAQLDRHPFHMPGHKGRFPFLGNNFDPTELPGLDNLHSPQDVLKRAQQRVADIYGAKKTYFLVNGSSVGIMAGMLAVVKPGDLVLVQRSCHKAVVSGLIHSGAMPVWIDQDYCSVKNHWLPPTKEQVAGLLAAHPIRAAIFTSPDYYGLAPELGDLTALCHLAKVKVVVDEAHGSHLNFGVKLGLPQGAVGAGCDIIVQSPHKTLPALTQSAWVHLNNLQLEDALGQALNLFHTTSPSYILLSSLEYAGEFSQRHGYRLMKKLSLLANILELKCAQFNLDFWSRENRDWTKFVMENRSGALELLHSRGIFPELVRDDYILFMLTIADAVDSSGIAALTGVIPQLADLPLSVPASRSTPPPSPLQECTPREAWLHRGERVALNHALGRISRQVVAPYPPGTMVVAPGQRLGPDLIEYLAMLHGGKVVSEWIEVI